MNQIRAYLEEQMTPTVALALAFLLLLLSYLVIDSFSKSTAQLESKILDQKAELAQMRLMADAPLQQSLSADLENTYDSLKRLLLNEETDGLNAAHFQQLVRLTLQECGMQNITMSVSMSADPEVPGLKVHEIAVRGRDSQGMLALCIKELSEMDVAANIDFVRWAKSGLFQANILGYSQM